MMIDTVMVCYSLTYSRLLPCRSGQTPDPCDWHQALKAAPSDRHKDNTKILAMSRLWPSIGWKAAVSSAGLE
jgi:hypothetical protein